LDVVITLGDDAEPAWVDVVGVLGDDAEPSWVDVVVDLLMSLLSEERQLVRSVVNCAFVSLTPLLTTKSLQLILDVSLVKLIIYTSTYNYVFK